MNLILPHEFSSIIVFILSIDHFTARDVTVTLIRLDISDRACIEELWSDG